MEGFFFFKGEKGKGKQNVSTQSIMTRYYIDGETLKVLKRLF